MSKSKRIVGPSQRTGQLKLYRSYMFRNRDPVIDELRTIVNEAYGRVGYKAYKDIEANGGPTVTCLHNWFEGDTKRPQSATVEAAGRAMGYRRVWQKFNKVDDGG